MMSFGYSVTTSLEGESDQIYAGQRQTLYTVSYIAPGFMCLLAGSEAPITTSGFMFVPLQEVRHLLLHLGSLG